MATLAHTTLPATLPEAAPLASSPDLFAGHPLDRRRGIDHAAGALELRPVLPIDAGPIAELVRTASERSRYRRFHGALQALSPRQLAGIVDVDHRERETLVVSASGELVAFGQYVPLRPGVVEIALMVADGWQGRGIGRELVRDLALAAQAAGYETLVAEVLAENQAGIKLMAGLGSGATFERYGTTVEARVSLRDAGVPAVPQAASLPEGRKRRQVA